VFVGQTLAMGKPQKMLLTAKKAKVDLVHPSDETMLAGAGQSSTL
jgi:5,10-methylene-tetrahydrofolate dehydrogenase/methenyl tetrahydrofolate cyclohydrolase